MKSADRSMLDITVVNYWGNHSSNSQISVISLQQKLSSSFMYYMLAILRMQTALISSTNRQKLLAFETPASIITVGYVNHSDVLITAQAIWQWSQGESTISAAYSRPPLPLHTKIWPIRRCHPWPTERLASSFKSLKKTSII